ncbi:MAG: hypothetical protein ABIT04_00565, partial [Novosphingobium sp.]
MSDRPRDHDGEDEQTRQLAPENANSEQVDADQAQTVADDALRGNAEPGLGDTEKVPGGIDDFDAQDLVDHMEQMVSSGRIDLSAFRGEPNLDDEDGEWGSADGADEAIEDD